jgi:hypothetical protein
LNPTSVVINAQGDGCSTVSAPFTASEAGYSGSFGAVSSDTTIATVSPSQSPLGQFTVTSTTTTNGGPGTTITVTDSLGHSATEKVTIATCLP